MPAFLPIKFFYQIGFISNFTKPLNIFLDSEMFSLYKIQNKEVVPNEPFTYRNNMVLILIWIIATILIFTEQWGVFTCERSVQPLSCASGFTSELCGTDKELHINLPDRYLCQVSNFFGIYISRKCTALAPSLHD